MTDSKMGVSLSRIDRSSWRTVRLGDVVSIKTGKRNNQDKTEHGKYPFYVWSQQVERISSFSFDGEAILRLYHKS